jgi:hypothetical protein
MISRDTVYAAIRGEMEYLLSLPVECWRVENFMCRIFAVNDHIGGIIDTNARLDAMREIAGWCFLAMKTCGGCARGDIGMPTPVMDGPLTDMQVQQLVNSERDYQDKLGPDRTDGRGHGTSGYIVMLRYYVNHAVEEWTVNAGDAGCLNALRKVAGIAVHCLEDCGVNFREPA